MIKPFMCIVTAFVSFIYFAIKLQGTVLR